MYGIPEYLAWFYCLSSSIIRVEDGEKFISNSTSDIGAKRIWELLVEKILDDWFYKTAMS